MKKILLFLIVILIVVQKIYPSVRSNLGKGNSDYKKEKYDTALQMYKLAETEWPDLPETMFNIGNVYYKTGNYEEAIKNYEKATYSKDIIFQSKAYYNTGNAMFRLGKLSEAIQFYKKTLELNPNDKDAKLNIEFAQKKLKENIGKSRKQSSQKQKEENKQNQNRNEKNPGKDKQDKTGVEKEKKDGMSKEDAKRLLETVGDEKRPKEKDNIKMPLFEIPEKDW